MGLESGGVVSVVGGGVPLLSDGVGASTVSSIDSSDLGLVVPVPERDQVVSVFCEVLWGLRPFEDLAKVDWTQVRSGVPKPQVVPANGRVFHPEEATSAVDLSFWWQILPAQVQAFIRVVKAAWPLRAADWEPVFNGDEDWPFVQRVLLDGVALVHPSAVPVPVVCSNYRSFTDNHQACGEVLDSELHRGLVVHAPDWFIPRWVHPLGAVPKKSGKMRIIHDCSAPKGKSLNDQQSFWYVPWASIDDILSSVSPGCAMAGIDLQEYYRNIGVSPACWPLQCYTDASDRVIVDSRLQFGHRMAPEVAMRISALLRRKLEGLFPAKVVAVMDDFTLIHPSHRVCLQSWQGSCGLLSDRLRLPLSKGPGKTEPPSTQKVSLGLAIDSVAMTVSLCPVKLAKLRALCDEYLSLKKVSKRQLDSLLGYLLWVSRVVYAGRTFCHNLRAVRDSLKQPWHRVRVSRWLRTELQWWRDTAPLLNGAQQILPSVPVRWADFQVDACLTGAGGQPGVGIWVQGAYNSLSFGQLQLLYHDVPAADVHISIWEVFAVVVAVRLYADFMAGQFWRVRSDNTQVVSWLMKGDAPPLQVSLWLKELASVSIGLRFRLTAKHIPGAANCMADALSRQQWPAVRAYLKHWIQSRSDLWL